MRDGAALVFSMSDMKMKGIKKLQSLTLDRVFSWGFILNKHRNRAKNHEYGRKCEVPLEEGR
jgi:hypothetical protein